MEDEFIDSYYECQYDDPYEREDDYNVFEERCLDEDAALEQYDADAEWRDEEYSDFD